MKKLLFIFALGPFFGMSQCYTDFFTVDNFNDHVVNRVYASAFLKCDFGFCSRCDSGAYISLPPFVQKLTIETTTPFTATLWLTRNCDSVLVDTCITITPSNPYSYAVDATSGGYGIRLCFPPNAAPLSLSSEPYLYPLPYLYGLFAGRYLCEIPLKRKVPKKY